MCNNQFLQNPFGGKGKKGGRKKKKEKGLDLRSLNFKLLFLI